MNDKQEELEKAINVLEQFLKDNTDNPLETIQASAQIYDALAQLYKHYQSIDTQRNNLIHTTFKDKDNPMKKDEIDFDLDKYKKDKERIEKFLQKNNLHEDPKNQGVKILTQLHQTLSSNVQAGELNLQTLKDNNRKK